MIEERKVLGQGIPSAGVLTDLYTSTNQAIVSTLMLCNQSTSATTARASIAVAGAADTAAQYIIYDAPLNAKESRAYTLGITLGPADVLRCYGQNGSVAFNAFGVILK